MMSATRSDEVCDLQLCDWNLFLTTAKDNGEILYLIQRADAKQHMVHGKEKN